MTSNSVSFLALDFPGKQTSIWVFGFYMDLVRLSSNYLNFASKIKKEKSVSFPLDFISVPTFPVFLDDNS